MRSPVRRRRVACWTFASAGRPYSRAMVDACDSTPPTSTMTPAARVNNGRPRGSVARVTRMAPRFIDPKSPGFVMTTTSASTNPRLTGVPRSSVARRLPSVAARPAAGAAANQRRQLATRASATAFRCGDCAPSSARRFATRARTIFSLGCVRLSLDTCRLCPSLPIRAGDFVEEQIEEVVPPVEPSGARQNDPQARDATLATRPRRESCRTGTARATRRCLIVVRELPRARQQRQPLHAGHRALELGTTWPRPRRRSPDVGAARAASGPSPKMHADRLQERQDGSSR